MLKIPLIIIKYILLIIDFTIIFIFVMFNSFFWYKKLVGDIITINNVEYELQEWMDYDEFKKKQKIKKEYSWKDAKIDKIYTYNIRAQYRKYCCEAQEVDWILFKIPKIYKIYKEENKLVVVVPKDMDTTRLDLYIKNKFYERKVLGNVIRDYYKGVKRPGIKAVDLIVEYVDKE